MPFLLLKLLGIGKWLRGAATALLGVVGRYPWQSACIALLALSAGLWRGNVSKERLIVYMKAERVKILDAQDQARAAQLAVNKAAEDKSRQIAKDSDNAHAIELADARTAADRYIAANRVRPDGAYRPGPAIATAQGDNPGVPDGLPAAGFVVVSDSDVQACTAATSYAVAAHNQAMDKIAAGLAVGE